jgi:hypothetical protein
MAVQKPFDSYNLVSQDALLELSGENGHENLIK